MGKRVGANHRKRKTLRSKKQPWKKGIFRFASTGVLYAGMFAAGTALLVSHRDRLPSMTDITDRLTFKHSKVESVAMQGAVHVTSEEILRRSGITLPVTLDQLKREYLYIISKTSPWIEKVHLTAAKKGAVTLGVVERKPVAMVRMRSGAKIALVDAEGVVLPLDPRVERSLPLVSGLEDSVGACGIRRLKAEDCSRMNRFFENAAEADSAFLRTITQVHFAPDRTVSIMVTGSATVIMLGEDAAAERLRRLLLVWEALEKDNTLRPGRIDLSYRNLAFVSMEAGAKNRSSSRVAGGTIKSSTR